MRAVLVNDGTETQLASFRALAHDETREIASYTFYGVMPRWVPLLGGEVEMDSGTGAVGRGDDGEGERVRRDGMQRLQGLDGGVYGTEDGVGRLGSGVPFPHGVELGVASRNLTESRCELDQPSFKRGGFQPRSAYRLWRRKDWWLPSAGCRARFAQLTVVLVDQDGCHAFGCRLVFCRRRDERHALQRAMNPRTFSDAVKGWRRHDRQGQRDRLDDCVRVSVCLESKARRTVVPGLVHTDLGAQDAGRGPPLPADPHTLHTGHDVHPAPVYLGVAGSVGRWGGVGGVAPGVQRALDGVHGALWRGLRVDEDERGGGEDGKGGSVRGGREGRARACGGCACVGEVGAGGVEVGECVRGGDGEGGEGGRGRARAEGGVGVDREGARAEEHEPRGGGGGGGQCGGGGGERGHGGGWRMNNQTRGASFFSPRSLPRHPPLPPPPWTRSAASTPRSRSAPRTAQRTGPVHTPCSRPSSPTRKTCACSRRRPQRTAAHRGSPSSTVSSAPSPSRDAPSSAAAPTPRVSPCHASRSLSIPAAARLAHAIRIVRLVAEQAVHLIARKPLIALVAHMRHQLVLPPRIFAPALLDYSKALSTLLAYPPHVESLDRHTWLALMSMCFAAILGDDLVSDDQMDDGDMLGVAAELERLDAENVPPHRPPVTLNTSSLVQIIPALLCSTVSPIVPPTMKSGDTLTAGQKVGLGIVLKIRRFFTMYPHVTIYHLHLLTALNTVLSDMELNCRDLFLLGSIKIFPHLVTLWAAPERDRDRRIPEQIAIAIHRILPHLAHSAELQGAQDVTENVERLMEMLAKESTMSRGIEPLDLGSMRLKTVAARGRHHFAACPFETRSFSAGHHFTVDHALSWTAIEIYCDACLHVSLAFYFSGGY